MISSNQELPLAASGLQNIEAVERPDFIAISFKDEVESVIFLPCSGEVLLSARFLVDSLNAPDPANPEPLQTLAKALARLGVEIG